MEGTKYLIVDELEIHIGSIANLHKNIRIYSSYSLLHTSEKNWCFCLRIFSSIWRWVVSIFLEIHDTRTYMSSSLLWRVRWSYSDHRENMWFRSFSSSYMSHLRLSMSSLNCVISAMRFFVSEIFFRSSSDSFLRASSSIWLWRRGMFYWYFQSVFEVSAFCYELLGVFFGFR